jgi:hypothetical protein
MAARIKSTITLPNGVQIMGTADQLVETASKLGYSLDNAKYYLSESRGLLRISEMDTLHIKNAMVKLYRHWLLDVAKLNGNKFVEELVKGPESVTFNALYAEYMHRTNILSKW